MYLYKKLKIFFVQLRYANRIFGIIHLLILAAVVVESSHQINGNAETDSEERNDESGVIFTRQPFASWWRLQT